MQLIITKSFIIQAIILSLFGASYLIFTARYFLSLQENILFTKRLKIFHSIMIWLIPFVWILLLKGLSRSAPGSHEVENKIEPEPFSKTGGTYIS